jgi:hypothetical protein
MQFLNYLPFTIFVSALFPLHASERGYLDAITADYEEFTTGVFEPPTGSTWVSSLDSQNKSHNLAYEKLEDFSSFLKEASPGSFIFYNKLPKAYQNQLHQDYLKAGNLDEIKQNIFIYTDELKKQSQH